MKFCRMLILLAGAMISGCVGICYYNIKFINDSGCDIDVVTYRLRDYSRSQDGIRPVRHFLRADESAYCCSMNDSSNLCPCKGDVILVIRFADSNMVYRYEISYAVFMKSQVYFHPLCSRSFTILNWAWHNGRWWDSVRWRHYRLTREKEIEIPMEDGSVTIIKPTISEEPPFDGIATKPWGTSPQARE